MDHLLKTVTGSDGQELDELEAPLQRDVFDQYRMYDKLRVQQPFLLNSEVVTDHLDNTPDDGEHVLETAGDMQD
jgi:hypothetical protein